MTTLEQLSQEYDEAVANRQVEILRGCVAGNKSFSFIEDNFPPTYHGLEDDRIMGGPKPYSETAPHWTPSLTELAAWILEEIKDKRIMMPIKDAIRQRVFVPDRNGIIEVELWLSDKGIRCTYLEYSVVDTLAPLKEPPQQFYVRKK